MSLEPVLDLLPQRTFVPQMAPEPDVAELVAENPPAAHTAELPQRDPSLWIPFLPHTCGLAQSGLMPHASAPEEDGKLSVVCPLKLVTAVGDRAAVATTSLLASAAGMSRYPAPMVNRSFCSA